MARSKEEAEAGAGLAEHCHRRAIARVHMPVQWARTLGRAGVGAPLSMGYFYSPALKRRIRSLLDTVSFDLIFVHCSSVAPYVEKVAGIPKLLDFGDMDSQKWRDYASSTPMPRKWVYWLEWRRLSAWERRLALAFDLCTATTPAELDTLREFGLNKPTDWFPNGVDFDYFKPAAESYDPNTITFVGRMDYYPNQQAMLDFCRDTLPLLRQRIPALKLFIVGAEPPPKIRRLGELPSVTVTGTVPDVRPYLGRSALTIAPLKIARGTQNKILQSMGMGVPVVCSRLALNGVDAVDGEHLLAADTPQEYAGAIAGLMNDPARRADFSAACRARMVERHSWDGSMRRLDRVIDTCMERQRAFAHGR